MSYIYFGSWDVARGGPRSEGEREEPRDLSLGNEGRGTRESHRGRKKLGYMLSVFHPCGVLSRIDEGGNAQIPTILKG
jgi:hypothetical protein